MNLLLQIYVDTKHSYVLLYNKYLFSGMWTNADKFISRKLDRNVGEQNKLFVYEGAVMRLTHNKTAGDVQYSQGQLCVVSELPANTNDSRAAIKVRLLPVGERKIHRLEDIPPHWLEVALKRRHSTQVVVGYGMMKARRLQFPLRYYVCSTIHKSLGETCPAIATQISSTESKYAIWERQMLLVLISRVQRLEDIHFVGSPRDTLKAMEHVLRDEHSMAKKQAEAIKKLDWLSSEVRIVPPVRAFNLHLKECGVPSLDCGFVYIAVSTENLRILKTGHCKNLKKEMDRLNDPSITEDSSAQPFALVAFIHGDKPEDNQAEIRRENLHTFWRNRIDEDQYGRWSAMKAVKYEVSQMKQLMRDAQCFEQYKTYTLQQCFELPSGL